MSVEQDKLVAEKVMRHKAFSPFKSQLIFEIIGRETVSLRKYTSDPAADYKVLLHVRENWGIEKQKLLSKALANMNLMYVTWFHHGLLAYQPGNWSLAALEVVNNEQ